MKKNLLIFNMGYHPFMYGEIKAAASQCEHVVVLSVTDPELEIVCKEYVNVELVVVPSLSYWSLLHHVWRVFQLDVVKEVLETVKKRKFDILYLHNLASFLYAEGVLKNYIRSRKDFAAKNWVFLSAWFTGTSYAVCKVKEHYPDVFIASMAHSFEVDDRKSKYVDCLFREFRHVTLDKLSFISRIVCDDYRNKYMRPNHWREDNLDVTYLGSRKNEKGMSNFSDDGILRLVSCSYCTPVKRIALIIEALKCIEDVKIEWTHFGGGIDYVATKAQAYGIANDNLKVNFVGQVQNKEVHRFYVEHPVDIFINVSSAEGIPVSLMEAAAYGIPLMATEAGGNYEICTPECGIRLGANPSPQEIAGAIKNFNSMAFEKKIKMRIASAKIFVEKFDADTIRKRFYGKLVAGE